MSTLTEDDILVMARQNDIALVHEARLSGRYISVLANGVFARCECLAIVDLSRNELTTLKEFQQLSGSLEFLNVSENKLTDLAPLASCTKLATLYVEGNQLKHPETLRPLNDIPTLNQVRVSRVIALDDKETFTLDNPFCGSTTPEAYARLLTRAKWVDDYYLDHYREGAGASGAAETEKNTEAAPSAMHEAEILKNITTEMEGKTAEERALERLLADVQKNL